MGGVHPKPKDIPLSTAPGIAATNPILIMVMIITVSPAGKGRAIAILMATAIHRAQAAPAVVLIAKVEIAFKAAQKANSRAQV